MFPNN